MAKGLPSWLGFAPRHRLPLARYFWRAFQRGCSLFTMLVRPWRRTTLDPSFSFSDFSEFLTFIEPSSFDREQPPPASGYSVAASVCGNRVSTGNARPQLSERAVPTGARRRLSHAKSSTNGTARPPRP
jgi:hypothetical protein